MSRGGNNGYRGKRSTRQVGLYFQPEFLALVDEQAQLEGRNRTSLIHHALRLYLTRHAPDYHAYFSKEPGATEETSMTRADIIKLAKLMGIGHQQ
ncbi:MAG: hypothetical protein DWQ49_08955 [Bacteroidetes bacterium]|nr:MAG: hypothetical protein DWQ49_08955 [Bacteroidota bacterium]